MDKYTKRYLMDCHGVYGNVNAYDLASIIKHKEYDDLYVRDAVESLDNEMERFVLLEEITKRRLGL